jgi:hypothetical protein
MKAKSRPWHFIASISKVDARFAWECSLLEPSGCKSFKLNALQVQGKTISGAICVVDSSSIKRHALLPATIEHS